MFVTQNLLQACDSMWFNIFKNSCINSGAAPGVALQGVDHWLRNCCHHYVLFFLWIFLLKDGKVPRSCAGHRLVRSYPPNQHGPFWIWKSHHECRSFSPEIMRMFHIASLPWAQARVQESWDRRSRTLQVQRGHILEIRDVFLFLDGFNMFQPILTIFYSPGHENMNTVVSSSIGCKPSLAKDAIRTDRSRFSKRIL